MMIARVGVGLRLPGRVRRSGLDRVGKGHQQHACHLLELTEFEPSFSQQTYTIVAPKKSWQDNGVGTRG
jgi:hypothetical protein